MQRSSWRVLWNIVAAIGLFSNTALAQPLGRVIGSNDLNDGLMIWDLDVNMTVCNVPGPAFPNTVGFNGIDIFHVVGDTRPPLTGGPLPVFKVPQPASSPPPSFPTPPNNCTHIPATPAFYLDNSPGGLDTHLEDLAFTSPCSLWAADIFNNRLIEYNICDPANTKPALTILPITGTFADGQTPVFLPTGIASTPLGMYASMGFGFISPPEIGVINLTTGAYTTVFTETLSPYLPVPCPVIAPAGSCPYIHSLGYDSTRGVLWANFSLTDTVPVAQVLRQRSILLPNNPLAGLDKMLNPAPVKGRFDGFEHLSTPVIGCPQDPTAKLTAVVGVNAFETVQAAYDAAANGAVIGIFINTTENVVLGGDKALKITQCTTARVTAKDSAQPVWTVSSTGKLTIVSPDAVGGSVGWLIQTDYHDIKSVRAMGASDTGIHIVGNGNRVSFNSVSRGPIGIRIDGDSNIVKGGTVSENSGDGVVIGSTGSNNTFSGANVQNNGGSGIVVDGSTNVVKDNNRIDSNGKNGILVTGNGNTISNNAAGSDKGKGNGRDGIKVMGAGTTLDKNRTNANGGNGVTITSGATGTKLKGNQSNQTAAGGSKENGGFEYELGADAINQGGNKADGISIPSAKKCPTFPATGTKCQ